MFRQASPESAGSDDAHCRWLERDSRLQCQESQIPESHLYEVADLDLLNQPPIGGSVLDDEGGVPSLHPRDKTIVAGLAQACPTPTTASGSAVAWTL
eukprot:11436307-Prorocentrum_lima.AAC.1